MGIGDISFISNDESLAESFEGWASNSYPHMAPRSFDDVLNGDIMEWLSVYARDPASMARIATAFPGSIEEESTPSCDTVENDQDRAMMDVSEDVIQQETELDEVDSPNCPSRKPNVEQDGEDYLKKYVSQSEGSSKGFAESSQISTCQQGVH